MHLARRLQFSSRVIAGAVSVALLAVVLASTPATAAARHDPITMADAFLVEEQGGWFCPGQKFTCSGRSQQFVRELLKPGYLPRGVYMRVAKAREDCTLNVPCPDETGVPTPKPCPSASAPVEDRTQTPFCALQALKVAGVRLGIVLSADTNADDKGESRSPRELAWHACQIRMADDHRLYQFMFLDKTAKLQGRKRKLAVQLIQTGQKIVRNKRVPCNKSEPDGAFAGGPLGWPQLITNDTTWHPGAYSLDSGAWAHAKRLEMVGRDKPATSKGSGLLAVDVAFVNAVNRLKHSRAVLRLEVTPDTSEFSQLGGKLQCSLLRSWATQQTSRNYSFLFPLYVHGAGEDSDAVDRHPYDSVVQETFVRQLELMANPDKAPSTCPGRPGTGIFSLPVPASPPVAQAPPTAARAPDVAAFEPTNLTCHSARLNGWVNPHGSPTRFHFQYWKRGEPQASQPSGDGDAGAGTDRVDVARVIEGLQRKTGYTGRLVASNPAGQAVSGIFSFTTPGC